MKCVNIKTSEESAQFDCPHCGVEGVMDDATIAVFWADYSGQTTCPPPQGCNQQYEIPTIEEVEQLRASGGVPEAAPQTQPTDSGTGEEVASPEATGDSESTDTKEPEEEEESSTPKFTGPWRPKSQSDEVDSSSMDEEFEKYVVSKERGKTAQEESEKSTASKSGQKITPKIFISYRREKSEAYTGRNYDWLTQMFCPSPWKSL